MAFLIGGANSAADTGFNISNSLRFNGITGSSGAYLNRTTGTATGDKKHTFSYWTKGHSIGSTDVNYHFIKFDDSSERVYIGLWGSEWRFYQRDSEGAHFYYLTQPLTFRDPSAWYHFCVIVDTTDGTAGDRIKLFVNGVRYTNWHTATTPSLNRTLRFLTDTSTELHIGKYSDSTGYTFDGYMSEIYFIDGQAKAATAFGEFDEDSGIWKPIEYEGTYGDEGFFLEFKQTGTGADASGKGADTSGNDNHFDDNNMDAYDITTDTPTNSFATLNPLMGGRGSTLSEGNLKVSGESDNNYDVATFGSDMKWYYEWKVDDNYDGAGGGIRLGAIHEDELATNDNFSSFANATAKFYTNSNDGKTQNGSGSNVTTGLTRATTNDIIMCACDGAGAKIWWGVNGTWLDYGSGTGDPAAGSNAATWTTAMKAGIWFPVTVYSGTAAGGQLNLGNPTFTISSGNADDAGYGNFEYDVPAGFYSLCTKNLAEYG